MNYFHLLFKCTAICFFLYSLPSMAMEKYALLVGVSKYPNLEARFQLEGPIYDVKLMTYILQEKGFPQDHIQILADGSSDETSLPTRQNILAALNHLTEQVKSGDFVFLHFAGHGSQQPVLEATKTHNEPDGLDELFLPRDIGHWQDDIGTVKNAIVDDELNKYMTVLRNKGAFTWVVFDSCHSGTMTRGIKKNDIRERRISPNALGIPTKVITANQAQSQSRGASRGIRGQYEDPSRGVSRGPSRSLNDIQVESALEQNQATNKGGYIAFYAAQTNETTPEMLLPRDNPEKRPYGLFTYTLAEVLTQHDGISYRQVAQLILQRYVAQNYYRPTPLFEGTHLDAPIFGTKASERISQWLIKRKFNRLKIPAGKLHGLSTGSIFAILPNATAHEKNLLGYLEMTQVGILESHLKSIAYDDKPALAVENIPNGAYARLIEPKVSLTLQIALPPESTMGSKPNAIETQARQVLTDIIQSEQYLGINIVWVQPTESADLHLLLKNDQLWLLPPTAELIETGSDKTHSISLNTTKKDLHHKLVNSFQSIAKVLSLLRLSEQIPQDRFAKQVLIQAKVERAGEPLDFEADKILSLSEGDLLTVKIENDSLSPVDVTILFIDSEYGITAIYPAEAGETNRLEMGGNDWLELELFADTTGIERLIVIAVKAQPNSMMRDFSFLAQPQLPRTRNKKANLYDLLLDAGFGVKTSNTRGIKRSRQRFNHALIKVFSWKMMPKPAILSRERPDGRRR